MKSLVQWLMCLALLPVPVGAQTRPVPGSTTNPTAITIDLAVAELPFVLDLYSRISSRSVLRPPTLPAATVTLRAAATNELEAAAMVERALAEKDIVTIPDGDKFVFAVTKAQAAKVQPRSSQIRKATAPSHASEALIPQGTVRFEGATLPQVLQIYAGLLGRKLEAPDRLPTGSGLVHFVARTALTKEEMIYAFDTLLAWHNLQVIQVGEEHIKAVRLNQK